MAEPQTGCPPKVEVDLGALQYVMRYLKRYDRMPDDEHDHPFWAHWARLDFARGDALRATDNRQSSERDA